MSFLINDDAMKVLFLDAQSANTYTDYEVSDAELTEVCDLIKWGPTGANNQPLRIVTVRPGQAKDVLLDNAQDTNKAKVESAPLNVILAADLNFPSYLHEQHPYGATFAKFYEGNDAARIDAAVTNAWLQAGYFILGLRARGFAVGPMAGFNFDKLKADLGLPENLQPFLVMGVGKPGENAFYPRNGRLDAEKVIIPTDK